MLKYLLLAAVLAVAFWLWRQNRRVDAPPPSRQAPRSNTPVLMVSCTRCGTHLPHEESIPGRRGAYCSERHRRDAGDIAP